MLAVTGGKGIVERREEGMIKSREEGNSKGEVRSVCSRSAKIKILVEELVD